jgi:hypothetical protein
LEAPAPDDDEVFKVPDAAAPSLCHLGSEQENERLKDQRYAEVTALKNLDAATHGALHYK